MRPSPRAGAEDAPRIVFLGEPQVGKSSLLDALAGARLMPTTGVGAPRSQAACEVYLPVGQAPGRAPGRAPDDPARWRVGASWCRRDDLWLALMQQGRASWWHLLGEGLSPERQALLRERVARAARSGRGVDEGLLRDLALGRETAWLPLDRPVCARDARRQLAAVAAGWASALVTATRLRPATPPPEGALLRLVDLPGVGGGDAGDAATREWLRGHAGDVAGIVWVMGKRTPRVVADLLLALWPREVLRERLWVVATHADELVDDPDCRASRARAAEERRGRAGAKLAGLLGLPAPTPSVRARIFCVDPRRPGRRLRPVDFDGELDNLKAALDWIGAGRRPAPHCKGAASTAAPSGPLASRGPRDGAEGPARAEPRGGAPLEVEREASARPRRGSSLSVAAQSGLIWLGEACASLGQ